MYAYEVHCTEPGCYAHTGGVLGGGWSANVGCFDANLERLDREWSRHHAAHEIHVEEISVEEYSFQATGVRRV